MAEVIAQRELRNDISRILARVRDGEEFIVTVNGEKSASFDQAIARLGAEIRSEGRDREQRYGLADSLIGATARHLGLPVYTQDAGFEGMAGVDVHVV